MWYKFSILRIKIIRSNEKLDWMSPFSWLEFWRPIVMLSGSTPAGGELFITAIKTGTGPSGSGHTLPGEAGLLSDRAHGMTREAENPGLSKKKKKVMKN